MCALFFATFGRLGSHFRCRSAFKPIRQAKHGKEQLFILNLTHSQRTHFRSARHQMIFSAPERRKIDTLFSCKITKLQSIKSNRFRSENLRSLIIVKLKGFRVNHFRLWCYANFISVYCKDWTIIGRKKAYLYKCDQYMNKKHLKSW